MCGIGQTANDLGTDHKELPLSENDLLESLPRALATVDQPTVDGINTYLILHAARERGLTVALSGLGGDELFAGYDSFHQIPGLNRADRFLSALPSFLRKQLGNLTSRLTIPSDKNTKLTHLFSGKLSGAHVCFLFRALFKY